MSRLFRFFLLLAGAGALIAVARHLSRQREPQQPFFADAYTPPTPVRPPTAPSPGARARARARARAKARTRARTRGRATSRAHGAGGAACVG